MNRDYVAEARALPEHRFDLLMHEYMWRTFKPWIDGVSALELGCFHGAMTGRIYAEYPDTAVVEASAECIAIAKGKWPLVEFFHTNFEGAILDRKFDAIFLIHTLEHVEDPVAILKRCREWLEPSGRLFVAVPNSHAASRQIAVGMGLISEPEAVTEAERTHGHRRTYSMESLSHDVHQAGFVRLIGKGGIMFKPLANFQFDKALAEGIIDQQYLEGCYLLGGSYPELCATVFMVVSP